MTTVFGDSFYFFALVSRQDAAHQAALNWAARNDCRVLTSSFVVLELADGLSRGPLRQAGIRLIRAILANPAIDVEPATPELFDSAWKLFEQRSDKTWSLTDCTSFVIMRSRGIVEALTADRHFVQAGFRALLLPPS
jgi:predicted nucleic acid-binding protein